MDIFGAVRAHYSAIKDEAAFDMNVVIQNQSADNAVKSLISAVRRFNEANQCLNMLSAIEAHYKDSGENKENKENED